MAFVERLYYGFMLTWSKASKTKKLFIILLIYTILFLVTYFFAYSPFILKNKSYIWIDGRLSEYPIFSYIGQYLRKVFNNLMQGNIEIPMFDFSIGLGADVFSTLNYYGFGDPLNLITFFFPIKYMEKLYSFFAIFRLYLAGLAFIALCFYHKHRFAYSLIGALIYCFSSYGVFTSIGQPFFINAMIQLPLLLIGIDLIIKRRSSIIFILAVLYSALCGFYFLYMMTIMLGIYSCVRFFDIYKTNRAKEFWQMLGRIVLCFLVGIGLASVMFIPAIIGYFESSRAGQTVIENFFSYGSTYYINNMLRFIAPSGASWNAFSLPVLVLIAIILLFTLHEKKYRLLKVIFGIIMLFYILPLGGYIMNGFGYPSQRWTFGAVLFFSYLVVVMFPHICIVNNRQKMVCFILLLIYSIFVFVMPTYRTIYLITGVAMFALTLSLLFLCAGKIYESKETIHYIVWHNLSIFAFLLLIIANVSVCSVYKFAPELYNFSSQFNENGVENRDLLCAVEREAEPYLFKQNGRFEGSTFVHNRSIVWQVPSAHNYYSLTNKYVVDFFDKTENAAVNGLNFNIQGTDQRTFLNSLLAIKYVIESNKREKYVPYGYNLIQKTENLIYENLYALPWGYTYDNYTLNDEYLSMNGLQISEAMLQTIFLDKDVAGYSNSNYKFDTENIKIIPYEINDMQGLEWKDGTLTVLEANSTLTLNFNIQSGTEAYIRFIRFDINNSGQSQFYFNVKSEGISKSTRATSELYDGYYGRENYLFNLGYSEEERTSCTITFPSKGTYQLEDIQLYALPMDNYVEQVEALRLEPLENIEWGTNRISGTVDLSSNKILCMSIPYSSGWSAKVDGVSTEILRGNIMFMALPLEAGHHEIEFIYCTPGIKIGLLVSILSWLLVIGRCVSKNKNLTNIR